MATDRRGFTFAGLVALGAAAWLGAAAGCAQDSGLEGDLGDGASIGGSAGSTGAAGSGNLAGSGGSAGRPEERENENRYLAPVVTGDYLWTANPLSGRVALIDVTTLRVTLETAGDAPTDVVGLTDLGEGVGALVLNRRSDDATLFRIDGAGRATKRGPFRTHPDANAWVVSPSGRWAIAWTDASRLGRAVDPLETFQDVTLFSLAPGEEGVASVSIGTRPSAFAFAGDDSHAYAVTEEGISAMALGDVPEVLDLIAVSDDPLDDPAARDVTFSLGGEASFALVRAQGSATITVVELPSGARETITLEGPVTDVDLAPGGERAFAVLGTARAVVSLPIPLAGADPAALTRLALGDDTIGAIALNADASAALLYSTVLGATRVSLVDASDDALAPARGFDLISPISAVFAAPDPRFAVAFQGPAPSSRKAGAFSLIGMTGARVPKIVATDALPTQIAFAPEGSTALVAVRSDAAQSFGAYVIDLASQQVDLVELASPPLAAGIVPSAGRAYVAQEHPEGRITLISLSDGGVQTLTGFELSARIVAE